MSAHIPSFQMALPYRTTPIQLLTDHPVLLEAGIALLVKREDMNHPRVSGNKWWKLKYNLEAAVEQGYETVLTFGGAYSNHIYATAAAAAECGLKSIGIIRGEETLPLNQTLSFAKLNGMRIHYVSRGEYRTKDSKEFVEYLNHTFGRFFLIPEGGSNLLAVKGCAEFAEKELSGINFDHLALPTGTGGTIAGLICGLKGEKNIVGISVLKDGRFVSDEVKKLAFAFSRQHFNCWSIQNGYHHGGYAKVTQELRSFIHQMDLLYNLPLDPVYTAKAFWAVLKEAEAGAFKRGDSVLFLHTGGLQGREGLMPS
jgi:1-aminocyclopropane-1-carboxylate deaminase